MLISEACQGMSSNAKAALHRKKIKNVEDLQDWMRPEIECLCGVGPKAMELLEKAMSDASIEWQTEPHKKKTKELDAAKEAKEGSAKRLERFDNKQTKWEGLWWNPSTNYFSSAAINLKQLREFKGTVRMYVRKNAYFNNGENGRPNYVFSFRDANALNEIILDVEDIVGECENNEPYCEDGIYYDEDGNRLYTKEDARAIINGVVSDVEYGFHDPYDLLPEDYVR